MSTGIIPRTKEIEDKENPPYPTLGLKKLNSPEEVSLKKAILGINAQVFVTG